MKSCLLSFLLIVCSLAVTAQSRWQKYDSIYFENLFLPNFSNLLMPKGYVEVLLNNSMLTANQAWASGSDPKVDINQRLTYNYVTAIGNVGVSEGYRFNAGVELHYAIGYVDSDPNSSPMNIFKSSPPGFVQRARAFTTIGPRIKWRPFKHNLHFVHTSTLQLPVLHDVQTEGILGQSRVQWGNQFLYSFSAGKKLAFFAQDDFYIYFKKGNDSHNVYYNALSMYGYLLLSKHVFPFVSAGYSAAYGNDNSGFKEQYHSVPLGVGIQYQYSLRFTLNAYYSQYAWAQNYTDWKTISLGLRGVF